ncbi:hypothetical protein QYE76_054711 [Lolium multiflorum]|uniref:Uncharacterized protein n=1 Tax=Lolium multiflorum TaxID=4521 RepID=A0AAD8SYH7_LOLMU|nr:hypothetical protein QYE76_054711 [Lolium multiflorum]
MGILAVTTGEASPGTHAARLLCLSGSSTSVETGVLAVEQKVDTNVVYPAEDVHGVAGHHGEVFLGPMLDANLDPFDDFGPNVQFQEDVEGDDEEMEPYVQTETYDLENGGSLVFERDLYLVSEKLERPLPIPRSRIHNTPAGEQQWMITADLKGSSEPPISERILFSFKAYSWVDGLAHALQEGLARATRKTLRLQRAKNVATITRLREKIRTLEVTVRTQQDQIQEMEEDGEDIQGGNDFLSDDNDFEDDEFTDEEDYEFLEAAEDGIIPIDVDEDNED